MSTPYTFGDSARAEQRLRQLAELYEPSSRAFLKDVRALLQRAPTLACDLGCGPGYTTRLVHEVSGAAETVGLDASERFLAQATGGAGLQFRVHDVTRTPFPCPPADLLYVRFLLTHLTERPRVLRDWAEQLAPNGLLAIEELDTMIGSVPALQRYYAIVEAMQRAHGQDLHVGRALPALAREAGVEVVRDAVARMALPGHRMAALHHLNIQTWRHDAFISSHYTPAELDTLEAELRELAAHPDPAVFVDYHMRQMVIAARK
jgi:SAM-dependent methyltransferase